MTSHRAPGPRPGPGSKVLDFGDGHASPGEARRFVRRVLSDWSCDHKVDDVLIVVSELVTNTVLHAGAPGRLRLSLGDHAIRVEVTDRHPGSPELQPPAIDRSGGRGLLLVSLLADRWGTTPSEPGKTVWAELAV